VALTDEQLERYARQVTLPGFGEQAQRRLAEASALVVGAGSLGSPALMYLTAAGVGRVGVVDYGEVGETDLASQPLHFTPDEGIQKTRNAAVKLSALNPDVRVEEFPALLDASNAAAIVADADVVLDCSSDPDTSLAVNDACCAQGTPLVIGEARGLTGRLMTVLPGKTACRRCALGDESDAASEGALGAVAGVVGSAQALEALKLLTGVGEPAAGRVTRFDGVELTMSSEPVSRRNDCAACADAPAAAQSR
jgi:molybdopterin/thiamine biosynthesis adenylyltransferase